MGTKNLAAWSFLLCVSLAGLFGCRATPPSGYDANLTAEACDSRKSPSKEVSIEELVAAPEKFHDGYVRTTGFYCSGFEESGLYSAPGCNHDKKLGVWLTGTAPDSNFRGQKVAITGKVDAGNNGHLAQWAAQVCVSELKVLDKRSTE
ncbi:TPA: hypothetical protein ACG3C3_000144 [Stenotrophomonas maltophilia]